jgi:hypothetical protein
MIFNSRRALTALTLASLLSASPVLAQGHPRARTDRTARPAATSPQPGLFDLVLGTLTRLVPSFMASGSGTPITNPGGHAGVRIDPDGLQASPNPIPILGPGLGHP